MKYEVCTTVVGGTVEVRQEFASIADAKAMYDIRVQQDLHEVQLTDWEIGMTLLSTVYGE